MAESDADLDELKQLEAEALAAPEGDGRSGVGSQHLGVERWVQFAYVGVALVLLWLVGQVVESLWDLFAEPPTGVVLAIAALLSGTIAVILYRHPGVHQWSHAVAAELAKVAWPPRKETWAATVVVIVTSLVAAVLMFGYDAAWSSLTDLIYKF